MRGEFVSVFAVTVLILLGLAAVGFLIFLARHGKLGRSKPRIRILPKEKIMIYATGVRACPACGVNFREADAVAKCEKNEAHVVHKECKAMMKGECPTCGGRLD
jgi:hypothetical protein